MMIWINACCRSSKVTFFRGRYIKIEHSNTTGIVYNMRRRKKS